MPEIKQADALRFKLALAIGLVTALDLTTGVQPAGAVGIDQCGQELGPGSYTLAHDLECDGTVLTEGGAALTINGPAKVNLNGKKISCIQDSSFTAILLLGEKIALHSGTIAGCEKGLQVNNADETGPTGKHNIHSLNVTGSTDTGGQGIEVRSDRNYFIGNAISNNAGEGLRIRDGNNNQLTHNIFYGNGDHGARVRDGNGNYFLGNTAVNNGSEALESGEGFKFRGDHNIGFKNIAVGNFDNGFGIDAGSGNKLIENFSANNGRPPKTDDNNIVQRFAGLAVDGTGSKIIKNTLWNNTEFDALDGNENCADNTWRQNVFGTSALGLAVQNDDGDTTDVTVVESPDCIR